MQRLGELLQQPCLAVLQQCQAHYGLLLNTTDSTAAAGAVNPAGAAAVLSLCHLQRRQQEQQLQAFDVAVGMAAHKLALSLGGVTAAQQACLQVSNTWP
jgi:carbohydrate-binding DOMON domain-containing protein